MESKSPSDIKLESLKLGEPQAGSTAGRKTQVVKASTNKTTSPEYVPDELLLKYDSKQSEEEIEAIIKSKKGEIINDADDPLIKIGYYHVRLPKDTDLEALVTLLHKSKQIQVAEPNFVVRSRSVVPNDPLFPYQWHLDAIEAAKAREIQRGEPSISVAILDKCCG